MDNVNTDESIPNSEILNGIPVPPNVNINILNETSENSTSENEKDIQDMNRAFELSRTIYEKFLAPQLVENEKLKRRQKGNLVKNLFTFLTIQSIFTYSFVTLLIVSIIFSKYLGLSNDIISELVSFIKFYISSIIVELISILFFIIKNVFDTSIVEMLTTLTHCLKPVGQGSQQ